MTTKGAHTQVLVLLLRDVVPAGVIEERLADFNVIGLSGRKLEGDTGPRSAVMHRPSAVVPYRPDEYGHVWIDIIDGTWPDSMGDPKNEPEVYAAWEMAYFGPGAWPRSLARACQHAYEWPHGRAVAPQHRAYIRIRCSYYFGAPGTAGLVPKNYDPIEELKFVTRIAAALVDLPGVLCFFNPSAECLKDARCFHECLPQHNSTGRLPLELWTNVRFFKFNDLDPEWWMLDTVGMVQFDVPDHEAWFRADTNDPTEVATFLRKMCAHAVKEAPTFKDGDVTSGPGKFIWQAFNAEHGRMMPTRRVIRWFPRDGRDLPDDLIASFAEEPILT
jgi:Domain of unknown function (DUF4261)